MTIPKWMQQSKAIHSRVLFNYKFVDLKWRAGGEVAGVALRRLKRGGAFYTILYLLMCIMYFGANDMAEVNQRKWKQIAKLRVRRGGWGTGERDIVDDDKWQWCQYLHIENFESRIIVRSRIRIYRLALLFCEWMTIKLRLLRMMMFGVGKKTNSSGCAGNAIYLYELYFWTMWCDDERCKWFELNWINVYIINAIHSFIDLIIYKWQRRKQKYSILDQMNNFVCLSLISSSFQPIFSVAIWEYSTNPFCHFHFERFNFKRFNK